jgi:hypothetical protein
MKIKVVKLKDKDMMQISFEKQNGKEFSFQTFLCEPEVYTNPLYRREFTEEDAKELIEYMQESFIN